MYIVPLPLRIFLSLFLLYSYSMGQLDTRTIKWGTHKGPDTPLYDPINSPWPSNPSSNQLLQDFGGTALVNSTGGPNATWSKGDLVELGFFASALGSDGAAGGTGGNVDTPSTNLFQGTWIALTSETYIGQDWGTGTSSPNQVVDAGEISFNSQFVYDGGSSAWENDVLHNNVAAANNNYKLGDGTDTPNLLVDHLAILTSSTKLGIRFYDSNSKSSGTTRYNTIMNTNWTWPGSNSDLEMFLHDSSTPSNLNSNLVFEFDNTSYGSSGTYTAKVDDTAVSSHGSAGALHSDDFKTSIAYLDNSSSLNISSANKDIVLSGHNGSNDITGGSDNILTINSNGVGTTSNTYTLTGDIIDTGASGGLELLKVGTGEQILTGAVSLISDTDSKVTIGEGTLTLKSSSNNQQFEYFTGTGTLKLDNTSNSSQTIIIGLANTSAKQTLSGGVTLSGSGTNTISVGGGEATGFGKHQEFSGVVSGAANLKKTGSGKLTLSGDNTFSGGVTIADGGGTKDGGILVAGHSDALGTGTTTIEHGKLSIGAGTTVTNLIRGEQSSNNTDKKSVIGGGVGNSAGVIDNGSGTQIDIGSGTGQINVLSPGIAHASSMSNGTSDFQVVAGNHNNSGSDDVTQSIGTIQIDKIGLKNGGVFDWEIRDFAGNNADGSDWDVLKFDTLDFAESGAGSFDVNIYSLAANGSAGSPSGDYGVGTTKTGASGFKFMQHTGTGSGWNNAPGSSRVVNGFNINSDNWAGVNDFYYGDWSVYYNTSDKSFYLQYSAVPEPSTYFMVTGLLLLPGCNFIRRFRKKNLETTASSDLEDC